MRLLRELSRRKLRTALTITGITIGNRERGQTVLLVTHDPEVGATCDRIIRMRDGVIVGDEAVMPVSAAPDAGRISPPGYRPGPAIAVEA